MRRLAIDMYVYGKRDGKSQRGEKTHRLDQACDTIYLVYIIKAPCGRDLGMQIVVGTALL